MANFMHRIIHPLMRSWVGAIAEGAEGAPQPAVTNSSNIEGPRQLRVLLIGGGRAAGYGVIDHNLGYTGCLARSLSARLGRGVELESFTSLRLTAARALSAAQSIDASAYDLVILLVGTYDLVVVTPTRSFGARMDALIGYFESAEKPPEVFVASIPLLPRFTGIKGVPTSLGNHHHPRLTAALDEVLRRHPSVNVLPLSDPASADVNDLKMSRRYAVWGNETATELALHLSDT